MDPTPSPPVSTFPWSNRGTEPVPVITEPEPDGSPTEIELLLDGALLEAPCTCNMLDAHSSKPSYWRGVFYWEESIVRRMSMSV